MAKYQTMSSKKDEPSIGQLISIDSPAPLSGNYITLYIFYWLLPEICTVFILEANWFQLYKGAYEMTDIIK